MKTPSDVLALIFAQMPLGTRLKSTDDLQKVIYQNRTDFSLLSCFVFSNWGPIPFSPVLADAFSALRFSRIIMWDGEFHSLGLTKMGFDHVKQDIGPKFEQNEVLQAKRIALIIKVQMKCSCSFCLSLQ